MWWLGAWPWLCPCGVGACPCEACTPCWRWCPNGLVDGLMGVTGDSAAAAAEGGLIGERLVGEATVNEERLSESEDVALWSGSAGDLCSGC